MDYSERIFYKNGWGISIISNQYSYGGRDGLYEIAVLIGDEDCFELSYDTHIASDVIGYLDFDKVAEIEKLIQELPITKEAIIKNRDVKINDICG